MEEVNINEEVEKELSKNAEELAKDIVREANAPGRGDSDITKHLIKRLAIHQVVLTERTKSSNRWIIFLSIVMAIGAVPSILSLLGVVVKMEYLVAKLLFLLIAILFSLLWGIYGIAEESREVKLKCKRFGWVINFGIFVSEFIGSFAGWCCLYVLVVRIRAIDYIRLGNFDVFLIIGAVIGMAGYSYKIVELIDANVEKIRKVLNKKS